MADGLIGAIVVHSNHDLLQKGVDFDDEIVLLIQDWMDVQSSDLITALASPEGWNGTPAPPQGDAILINGLGQTNCSNEDIQVQTTCLLPTPPEIQVVKGRKTRLRVINSGTYGLLRLSIDQHAFTVIEADDTPVHGPSGVHEICITVGQRYSIVIDADQGKAGDGFWIRVNSAPECLVGGGHVQTGLAVLRYVDEDGSSPSKAQPDTYAWNDLAGADGPCEDFDMQVSLVPRSGENAPTEVLQRHILSSQLGAFVDVNGKTFFGYGINNVSFESQMSNPLLLQLIQGKTLDDRYQASAIFDSIGGGDIVINNLDATSSHPFHLHGRSFWIVARGRGALGPDDGGVGVNTTAPLRRDTIEIPGDSYAILRIISDVSGVWPLHCHIGYHLAIGKMSAIVVNPPAIQEFTQPDKWKKLCSLYKGPAVVHGN
ncbi:Cupredoxin [Naematelia encephala]|uniref:Cupredoxin n=1 Tax=Naematelia encephala TaxID=71784 RepID=A0A1Y2B4C1_9TREE|nr:Cupredoxin [Naematelia encephala]